MEWKNSNELFGQLSMYWGLLINICLMNDYLISHLQINIVSMLMWLIAYKGK